MIWIVLFFSCIAGMLQGEEYCFEEEMTLTINSAVQRLLECNREVMDIRDNLLRANLSLEREKDCFYWKFNPDAILGYSDCSDKHKDSDFTYGMGMGFSKKLQTGQRIYLHPAIQKHGKEYKANLTASVTLPLLRGFGRGYAMNRVYAGEFSWRNAYRQAFQRHIDLMQKGINSLYNIVKLKEIVRLNHESYQRLQQFLEATKLKEQIGIASAMDIYRAELEMKNAEDRYTASLDQLKDSEDQLRDMLVLSSGIPLNIDVPLQDVIPEITIEEAVQMALKKRIEMEQADDAIKEAKRLCRVAKKDLLPELNLVLDYTNSYCYDRFRNIKNADHKDYWRAGFTTSKELDSFSDKAQYTLSHLAIEQAERSCVKTREMITLEAKRAWRAVERSKKQIEIQNEQVVSSEGSLKLSSLKFDRGLANNFDVIQAEKNLHQAQIQLFSAMIDLITNQIKLRAVLGVFAEKPQIPY